MEKKIMSIQEFRLLSEYEGEEHLKQFSKEEIANYMKENDITVLKSHTKKKTIEMLVSMLITARITRECFEEISLKCR